MMEPLRNKWAVGVIAFSVVTVLVYIFMPLFKIPIFGISSGVEWIRMVWMTKEFANIVSFLLPFIGAAGAISVVLTKKNRASHPFGGLRFASGDIFRLFPDAYGGIRR